MLGKPGSNWFALFFTIILLVSFTQAGKNKKLAKWQESVKKYKIHSPKDFYTLIDRSKAFYKVQTMQLEAPVDFVPAKPTGEPIINPYLRLTEESDSIFLIEDKPQGEIIKIFKMADKHLFYRRYEEAIGAYREAMAVDSTYFKTWSYLGNTYYLMGRYEEALRFLKRALELNEIGFQEYCFLADTYYSLGDLRKAQECITYAYMLNKLNPEVQAILNDVLDNLGLIVRQDRLRFPLEVKKIDKKTCEINFPTEDDFNFIALGNCLACWQMEKRFKPYWWGYRQKKYFNELMIKECLLNQAMWTDGLLREGKTISQQEKMLQEAVREGYMNALLVWEIGASQDPGVIFYLPPDQRDIVVDYIKKYVFMRK
jgi:tetratricopeptide (TPR) repeat protein